MLAVLLLNQMSMRRSCKRRNAYKIENKIDKNPDVQEYCRTCLSTRDLVSLFYNKESEKKRSEDLKLVTGLEIKMDDALSQKICIRCVESVNNALTFRRTSKKAEKALRSMEPRLKTKKKCETNSKKAVIKKKIKKKPKYNSNNDLNDDLRNDDILNDDLKNEDINNDDFINDDFNNDAPDDGIQADSIWNDETIPEDSTMKRPRKRYSNIPNATSYKCSTCNKEFRMKATYKAHMRFHTNYCVCESCGKRCRNNNQLQEHKRARHGLGRIHKCAYCEYSSATKEALVIHERRHTGERPYVCDHCGATFHRRSNLVQHIAIHLPEKNFQCEICNKREFSQKRLNLHIYGRHKITNYRFVCPICSGIFSRPRNVRKHLIRIHGVARPDQGRIEKVDRLMVPITPGSS